MARKLYIDGNTGTASITDPDYPDAVDYPYQYLNAVYFHSSFPYLQFINALSVSNIVWPSYTPPTITWTDGNNCGC